jgi:hypothetical protein
VSPAASTTPLNEARKFRALPRDRSRRRVNEDLSFTWELVDGEGCLDGVTNQEVEYRAPTVPGLARLKVTVTQREVTVTSEGLITVTDSLKSAMTPAVVNTRGLTPSNEPPARCGAAASTPNATSSSSTAGIGISCSRRATALQLRYLVRLYVKELVLKNFAGFPADQLLERMIELSLYAEEKLKS